jgi:NAD(P)-dependent dehydrogenase (short-subunit alcohol dehydrogenase family)
VGRACELVITALRQVIEAIAAGNASTVVALLADSNRIVTPQIATTVCAVPPNTTRSLIRNTLGRSATELTGLAITWHTEERGARATADEVGVLGRRAEVRQLDLRALPGAAEVVDELAHTLGGVDVLVNNAGTGCMALLVDLDYDTWRQVIATVSHPSCAPSAAVRGQRRPAGLG